MERFAKEKIMSQFREDRLRQKIEDRKQEIYERERRSSRAAYSLIDVDRTEQQLAALQQQTREYQQAQLADAIQQRQERYFAKSQKKEIDKYIQPIYSPKDVDSLITMLTLWVDDRKVIRNMEDMYKHWKATQKI